MATDEQILDVIRYCFDRMPTNTKDTCVAFVNEVCHQLRGTSYEPGAGLIAKSAGQEHGTGSDGEFYALDALWVSVPNRAADILVAAPVSSSPWLYWYDSSQIPLVSTFRPPYGQRTLALYGGGEPPDPPDPPDPPPTTCQFQATDLTPILARLDQLEQEHATLLAEIRAGGWPVRVSNGWLTLSGTIGPKGVR
jgi:hypothetical protein